MKKWLLVGVCVLIGLGALLLETPEVVPEEVVPDPSETTKVVMLEGKLVFRGEICLIEGMIPKNGRLCLPWEETDQWMRTLDPNYTPKDMGENALKEEGNLEYISLNDFCDRWNLWPVFSGEGITFYRYEFGWEAVEEQAQEHPLDKVACLRLEDIMADPTAEGRFTHEKLEKVRILIRWLWDQGQEYSVAWIPIFVNPVKGIVNDLTEDYHWYNVDFLYTLDMMAEYGGHIGVHGLTHQYGEDVSAAGWEFGEDSPFTLKEAEERMVKAKAIAERLGFAVEFFEFPHYGMTKAQGMIAERHFDVIYQQELWTKPYGYVETKQVGERIVMYVPTPADCVQSVYDYEGMLQRLEDSYEGGQLVSLFFHPSLDYDKLSGIVDNDGNRRLEYAEDRGILSGIIQQIENWELQFGVVW